MDYTKPDTTCCECGKRLFLLFDLVPLFIGTWYECEDCRTYYCPDCSSMLPTRRESFFFTVKCCRSCGAKLKDLLLYGLSRSGELR